MRAHLIKEDGRVFEVKVNIEVRYIDSAYAVLEEDCRLSDNGWLRIFSLKSTLPADPSFTARWDGGSREVNKTEITDLDIDIIGVSERETRWFRSGKNGYSGHHSLKTSNVNRHEYEVIISIPQRIIFEGYVRVHLHRRIAFMEKFQISDRVEVLSESVLPDSNIDMDSATGE